MSSITEFQLDALQILNAAPDNYLILLPDTPRFTIVGVTDAYLKATFTKRKEILGRGLFEVFPDDPQLQDATGVHNLSSSLYYVLEQKQEHRMEDQRYDVPNPDGSGFVHKVWRPLNRPVLTASGKVKYIIHHVEDVTALARAQQREVEINSIEQAYHELNKAQNALIESEERFRTMANSIPQLAWMTDPNGWIYWYNDRWYQYTGTTPEEMLGWGWRKVHHPDLVEGVVHRIKAAFESGNAWEDIFLLRSKEGEYRWFLSRALPVRKDDGTLIGWFGTNTDITQQRQMEEALQQSESNLRNLVLQAPVAMCIGSGPSFIVEVANDRMLELWRKRPEEIIGKPVFEVLPQAGEQRLKDIIHQVYATGEPFTANEMQVFLPRNKKLETVYLNFVYEPVKNSDGLVTKIITVAINVTEQVVARQKIEESHREFQFVMDFVPQMIWLAWPDGFHYYYNKKWFDYTGVTFADTEGEGWQRVFHPDDAERARKLWQHSLATGEPYEIEFRCRRHDGQYRWFLTRALPLKDETGTIIKWFGTDTDIHDQKTFTGQLEKNVAERTKELQQSNEDLQQFVHVSSHDLKEPVRKIKFFANLLFDEAEFCLDERSKIYLSRVQAAAERMWVILEGVLTYSQVNFLEELYEQVDLNQVIRDVKTDLELPIQEKSAAIHYSNLPIVEGAPIMLHLVFYNLISNSLKFSRAGVAPVITITAGMIDKKFVRIAVEDNGLGFEQKYAEKIFGTFTRLHTKDKYEGAGLGLSICKKIIERHGGSIVARGVEDKGTVLEILLPVGK